MQITCPQCATQYRVDAAKFPAAGRVVRCAKCGGSWHQDALAEAPAPVAAAPEPEPVFAAPPSPPEPAPPRRAYVPPAVPVAAAVEEGAVAPVATSRGAWSWVGALGLGIGWLGLAGLVLVIGFSALVWRQQVAQIFPRTASLYATLGLTVNPTGLGFVDVTHYQQSEDGQPVLAIAGKLVNTSSRTVSVPPIQVTLTDATRHEVLRKSFAARAVSLEPGEITTFLARLSSPPAGARHMELRFAEP